MDPKLVHELEEKGVLVLPLAPEFVDEEKLKGKACQ
jgi:hypothetical protein